MRNQGYLNNNLSKNRRGLFLLAVISFIVFVLGITIERLKQNGVVMASDAFFHTSRIQEIDYYFKHLEMPNWLNFQTFNRNGQAINGMYPDLTLWPFVLLTIGIKSIVNQVIVIRSLILIFAFLITLVSLIKRKFDKVSSTLVAVTFVLSGFYSSVFYQQFQPNTMLAVAISFPLLFTMVDIFSSKRVNLKLAIKAALLMGWLLFSHLVSVIVVVIVLVIVMVAELITYSKRIWYQVYNLSLAALLTLIISAPFLYRYYKISSSGLLPPFRAGMIGSEPFMDLITKSEWDATNSLPLVSLFCLILVIAHHSTKNSQLLIGLSFVEFTLMVLCTSLVPWSLLDKVPFINNFQYAQWRFAIFLSVVPFILFLLCYRSKYARPILGIFAIIAVSFSIQAEYNFHQLIYTTPVLSTESVNQNPISKSYFVKDNALSNYTNQFNIPDYAPKSMKTKTVYYANDSLSDSVTRIIYKRKLSNINHHTTANAKLKSINNGIILKTRDRIEKGEIQTPVIGYKGLEYKVVLNHKTIPYHVNKNGFIQIHSPRNLYNQNIKITFNNPAIYNLLIIFDVCIVVLYFGLYVKLKN